MNSVSEKIDVRILRLLGLTDVFDLDYDTYLTLIREAIVTGQKRLPLEELALLSNEKKRIRGKKGRFKPRQKINASNVATTKFLKPAVQPISTPLLPAATGDIQSTQVQPADLSPLQGPLESIKKTLSNFFNFRKDASEDERREYEKQRRSKREAGLEGLRKGMAAVADVTKKFVAPFQGIIDRIWRFIFFTLLGRAFTQLMNWFNDPKNKTKVEVLSRFLKDWWPTLLGAAVLFLTPFGKFVRGVFSLVGGFAGKLVAQIPRIGGAIKSLGRVLLNPWVAVPAAAIGLAAAANAVTGQQNAAPVQAANKARAQTGEGLGVQGTDTMADTAPSVGNMGATTPYGLLQGAAGGGSILDLMNGYFGIDRNTGHSISGFGPDTQLIAAMPGEVVINKPTVDALGADTFLSLNKYYGGSGANQPRFGRFNSGGILKRLSTKIPRFQGGGLVNWYNKGRNVRIPNESSAGWRQLFKDDISQRGKFQTPSGFKGWNPLWSFTKGLGTGPTPLGRQAVERGLPRLGLYSALTQMQGSTPQSGPAYEKMQKARGVATAKYAAKTGQFGRYQGGGLIRNQSYKLPRELGGGGGGTDAIIEQEEIKSRIIPNRLNKILFNRTYDPQKYNGGGLIKENTGMNIRGATADRQLAALQPGEYVLPVDTVNRLGISLIDKLVASTDSNSTPFKMNVNKSNIRPLPRRNQNVSTVTLPPITSPSGSAMGSTPAGTQVPIFSATSLAGSGTRVQNAIIYGIEG
jgi:hypothetical protein